MKKKLALLLTILVCVSIFATESRKVSAEIGAKINISWLAKNKIKADSFEVWEQLNFNALEKGVFSQRAEYTHALSTGKTAGGLQVSVGYENEKVLERPNLEQEPEFNEFDDYYETVYGHQASKMLTVNGQVFFNMPEVNGKLVSDSVGAVIGFSLNNKGMAAAIKEYLVDPDPDFDIRVNSFTTDAKLGYIYSIDGDFEKNGVVVEVSELLQKLAYGTPYKSYKLSTSGILHFVNGKVAIENGSAGFLYKGSIQNTGFQGGVEYRYSYLSGPETNGVYLALYDLTAGVGDENIIGSVSYLNQMMVEGLSLEPIESYFPSDKGVDFTASFHKIDDSFVFDINHIYIPLSIKFGKELLVGLDSIVYDYNYEDAPEDDGFFIVLDASVKKGAFGSYTTLKLRPHMENKKFGTDLFMSSDICFLY